MSEDAPVPAVIAHAPLPAGFSIPGIVALARDLAIGMYDEPALLKKHEITAEQYATLQSVPYFQKVVAQLAEEWHAPKSAQQRLAIQTAVGLEQVLPDVIARATVKHEPLNGVAQLVKVLADIAGANQTAGKQQAAPREQFKITINLGADTEVYNKSKPTIVVDNAPTDQGLEVAEQPKGQGDAMSIFAKPEAS